MTRALVLGLGHPARGDDGVGPALLARLRGRLPRGVAARELAGDALGLLAAWEEVPAVLLLDALESDPPPGTVLVLDLHREPVPVPASPASSHGLGLAEAVALGRATGRLPAWLRLVGVVGASWEAGAELSPPVAAALDEAAGRAAALLEALGP